MIQSKLLILLLLVSFNSFSQTDTIKKIVLDEKAAREVVKDIVKGDLCKKHLELKEEEIDVLHQQIVELTEVIKIKEEIISKKDEIIVLQDKAIGWWKKPEIHGYVGIQTINATLVDPYIYGTLLLEFPKFSLGGQYFAQPNNPSGYGIIVEYNLF